MRVATGSGCQPALFFIGVSSMPSKMQHEVGALESIADADVWHDTGVK